MQENDAGKLNTVCKAHKRRATHHLADVRYWGEADIPRWPVGFRSVANDPKRKYARSQSRSAAACAVPNSCLLGPAARRRSDGVLLGIADTEVR
jgi:hypothetical protein